MSNADIYACRRPATCYLFLVMKARTVRDVAALARSRRQKLGLSQADLAEAVGVGREWIIEFEKGKSTVEWGLVVRTLRELKLEFHLVEAEEFSPERMSEDLGSILNRHRQKP